MSIVEIMLWDVLPYVTVAVLAVGTWWRFRYDKFGWTTRSSQLYERRLLRIASPLFHLGILAVAGGHVVGLLIPQEWTDAIGVGESAYHTFALVLGGVAGAATLGGIVLLIYRRRTTGPVFTATTVNDKVMYVFLAGAICLGLVATMSGAGVLSEGHNYREDVSVWFRSLFVLQPQGELMAQAPLAFRAHAVSGMLLFMIWPFTRLIHAFSAPVGYLFRPYVVYRTKDSLPASTARSPRRGWERVGG